MSKVKDPKLLRKVVLFHHSILAFGGAERFLYEEYKYFKNQGIETKILTFNLRKDALDSYYNEVACDIEVLEGSNLTYQIWLLRKKLLQLKPDIVITASGWSFVFLATLLTNISYILHIHGTMFWFPGDKLKYALIYRKIFNKIRSSLFGHREFIPPNITSGFKTRFLLELRALLNYFVVKKAKKVTVPTERIRWEVKEIYSKDSIIARGCLNPAIFAYKPKRNIKNILNLAPKTKLILSISRLDPRKRLDLLIKAFAKVTKQMNNIMLVIVGTGKDEKRLKELVRNLKISNRIIFTGYVNDNELWDYYNACDVFACPGWTTSPITAYEALAFRKKVVWSSEASELEEILSNTFVFLADPDPHSFAKALRDALNSDIKTDINLSKYKWENFFQTVYNTVIEATNCACLYDKKVKVR